MTSPTTYSASSASSASRIKLGTVLGACLVLVIGVLAHRSGMTWHLHLDRGFLDHARSLVLGANADHLSHVTGR